MKTIMVDEETRQECADFLSLVEGRLLQDETQTRDSKGLSQWFAGRPNARQEARSVAEDIAPFPVIDPTLLDKKPTSPTPAEQAAERLGYEPFNYCERS